MSCRQDVNRIDSVGSTRHCIFQDFNWMPYGFFSKSFGVGLGAGGAYSGWPAEETSVLGAITLGTKGSYNIVGSASDLRFPGVERLYMQPLLMFGRYHEQFLYIGRNNPGFEGQRAGANDSDQDNYIEATQNDYRVELDFRYLLPIGHGADGGNLVNRYIIERGFLSSGETGGTSWNPLTSGRTYLHLTPQWRWQTLERDGLELPLETYNVEIALERDNRDFPFNATDGSYQYLSYKKDFYSDAILDEWDLWTAEYSKLWNLGANKTFKQQVIAFDWWTGYVPSWETETVDGSEVISGRPPQYDGAILGGLNRMKAFEDARFQDKASIYYSLEYRFIPQWQPLDGLELLKWADIQYWQWVLFAETGQVSPNWNLSDLHSDLHYDGGIGLRGMIYKSVCRLDFAFGEEGMRMVAMYGHPF
jgi:hypothetical protein